MKTTKKVACLSAISIVLVLVMTNGLFAQNMSLSPEADRLQKYIQEMQSAYSRGDISRNEFMRAQDSIVPLLEAEANATANKLKTITDENKSKELRYKRDMENEGLEINKKLQQAKSAKERQKFAEKIQELNAISQKFMRDIGYIMQEATIGNSTEKMVKGLEEVNKMYDNAHAEYEKRLELLNAPQIEEMSGNKRKKK